MLKSRTTTLSVPIIRLCTGDSTTKLSEPLDKSRFNV